MTTLRSVPDPDSSDDLPPGADPFAPEVLGGLSLAAVESRLRTWAGRVAAGEARLLALLGEFDERRAWAGVGMRSCAHWATWRLGWSLTTAMEKVRVARALRLLPAVRAAFDGGRLSFSQVRAVTRIATPANEQVFLDLARSASAGQLEAMVGGIRRAIKGAAADAAARRGEKPEPVAPRVSTRYNTDGNFVLTLVCAPADGVVVQAALDGVRTDLDQADSSAEESPRLRTPAGAGLLELARRYLADRGRSHPARARRDRSKLTVHVDPLSGWVRLPDGELLPPGTVGEGLLDIDVTAATGTLRRLTPDDLTAADAGRDQRDAPQALRDLLTAVDGPCCRYPTCTQRRNLHAHHVVFWANGGHTDLANTIWLCTFHHQQVHEHGLQLTLHPTTRALEIRAADGTVVPARPDLPWADPGTLDPKHHIASTTLPPNALDSHLGLGYAVSVLMQWIDLPDRTAEAA